MEGYQVAILLIIVIVITLITIQSSEQKTKNSTEHFSRCNAKRQKVLNRAPALTRDETLTLAQSVLEPKFD